MEQVGGADSAPEEVNCWIESRQRSVKQWENQRVPFCNRLVFFRHLAPPASNNGVKQRRQTTASNNGANGVKPVETLSFVSPSEIDLSLRSLTSAGQIGNAALAPAPIDANQDAIFVSLSCLCDN